MASIAVLGAGSWGTALATTLCRSGHHVTLWGRNATQMQNMREHRENTRYLPGLALPEHMAFSANLSETLHGVDAVLLAAPCSSFRSLLKVVQQHRPQLPGIIWACKGFEPHSSELLHRVVIEELGEEASAAIVSGPSFAKEVVMGLPTAITVASTQTEFGQQVAAWLHSDTFRAYHNTDIVGVELGGALKNVYAIAAGIADGLQFGANARAALVTRGLAELIRLGESLGARRETLMGLSGLGDLMLTCTDDQSRNRRLGLAVAKENDLEKAIAQIGQAVEGVQTTKEAFRLADQHGVDMPIVVQVYAVLCHQKPPADAVRALLGREQRAEQA